MAKLKPKKVFTTGSQPSKNNGQGRPKKQTQRGRPSKKMLMILRDIRGIQTTEKV